MCVTRLDSSERTNRIDREPLMGEHPLAERVGETVRTVEGFVVEAGKVAEYANAVRNDNPVHRNAAAASSQGFSAIPAPLTFTATKRFPRYRPEGVTDHWGFDLGFDPETTVHGEKAFEFGREISVGDELTGDTTLEEVYQRSGSRGGEMTFAVLATEFTDSEESWVLTERSTLIETEGSDPDEDRR